MSKFTKIFILFLAGVLTIASTANAKQQENKTKEQKKISLETIKVIGTDQKRYRPEAAKSITGFKLDFLELPRVVESITEQIILDQKVTELEEALRNVPGISLSDGFGGSNNDYLIRGFRRNTLYRDGLRIAAARANMTNVERVMVVKGPASMMYGQVEPGGLVDIITKKPYDKARNFFEVRAGTDDDYLLHADVSQPIGDKGAIRVNATTQRSDYFRDFFDIERDAIAITGVYNFTENTSVDASYEYSDQFRSFDRGTITIPTPNGRKIVNKVLDIPLSRRFGEASEEIDTELNLATLGVTHKLTDQWKLRLLGTLEDSISNDFQARPRSVIIYDKDAPIVNGLFTAKATPKEVFDDPTDQVYMARRSDGSRERKTKVKYLNALLSGAVETGSIIHNIAVGADWRKYENSRYFVTTATTNGISIADGGNGPLFDVQNPIYGNLPDELPTDDLPLREVKNLDYGFFINDYIDFTDQLSVLLGGRIDYSDIDDSGPINKVNELSPQLAINYKFADNISMFASYSEAFKPNSRFAVDSEGNASITELLDPEDSNQIEFGVKAQFFNNQLDVSAALYKIEKENVVNMVDGIPELVKGQDSQGLELSVSGQPMPGMNIVAGYAYTDAEVKTGSNAGKRPRNVAKNTFNLWVSHELQEGKMQSLGIGAGAFYMSDRYGDNKNSWSLGSYTLVDASMWYTLPVKTSSLASDLRLQLSVKNLFDKEHYIASGGDLRVSIGAPRTAILSLSATF